jgi:hypothetical protein
MDPSGFAEMTCQTSKTGVGLAIAQNVEPPDQCDVELLWKGLQDLNR